MFRGLFFLITFFPLCLPQMMTSEIQNPAACVWTLLPSQTPADDDEWQKKISGPIHPIKVSGKCGANGTPGVNQ